MDRNIKFIRFSGVLFEDMEFVRSPGWEVSQIRLKEDDDPNGRYKIDLLDEENQVITTVRPSVILVLITDGVAVGVFFRGVGLRL